MAPSTGKPVKLLVANKKVMDTEKTWNKLEYPVFSGTDGVYFIDDEDLYNDVLQRMAVICKKPVRRIYYIDSDNDEVPIDSDVEFKEALKLIGERTNKGKFTTMKIDIENDTKNDKKKIKKTKSKLVSKVGENSAAKKAVNVMSKKLKPDPTRNIETIPDGTYTTASTSEISTALLEKHFMQLKIDLMAELKSILEPFVEEQKRISNAIASLQVLHMERESPASNNLKQQTESDHNYSAASNSRIIKRDLMSKEDSVNTTTERDDKISLSENEFKSNCKGSECLCADCICPIDDENLSVYSGEISVTESESEPDEIREDFIHIPLPSCFNVIAPQGASLNKPKQRNRNDKLFNCETKKNQVHTSFNAEEHLELETNFAFKESAKTISCKQVGYIPGEQITHTTFSESTQKANIEKSPHEKQSGVIESTEDEKYEEDTKDCGGSADEDKYNDYSNNYYGAINNEYDEENNDKTNGISLSPTAYQLHLNQPAQHVNMKNSYLPENSLSAALYTSQCNALPLTYESTQPAICRTNVPLFPTQTSRGFANPTLPIKISAYAKNCFGQESQLIEKKSQEQWQIQQQPISSLQPLVSTSPPSAATIIAQHQNLMIAARRAAFQAQQTQALCLFPSQTSPSQHQPAPIKQTSESKSSFENTQSLDCQDDNVDFGAPTSCSNTAQRENTMPQEFPENGSMCHLMQEAVHELNLWNEVDQVDVELHKWVKMCQYLMEHPPKVIDGGEKSKKFSAAAAAKTHQDLERVYQQFRKEVQLVSTQIDSHKQQKQSLHACRKTLAEDPIAILPEKLMQIISSTLNTTFNLLSHLSKLGVMNPSSSAPSEESKEALISTSAPSSSSTSSSMEKPQPQISAAISPLIPGMGNVPVGCTGEPIYYYPIQTITSDFPVPPSSSILRDAMGNQLHTLASYLPTWGQNIPSTIPALNQASTAMLVPSQTQPQSQQQQSQALRPTQFQLRQPQSHHIQQQYVLPQFQQHIQMQQLQQVIQRQMQP